MKQGRKLNEENQALLISLIAKGIIENNTMVSVAEELKTITGIGITEENVFYYRREHRERIAKSILEMCQMLVKYCPITHKDFRLHAIQKEYERAFDIKDRLACIREARSEVDEHGDKIAEALKNSGNRVNIFEFGNISDEERESYQKQFGAYFNRFNGNGSRIHTTD